MNREQRTKTQSSILPLLFVLCPLLFAGCASIIQKGGELLEGSAFDERSIAVYQSDRADWGKTIEVRELESKDGVSYLEISSSEWPELALRGTMPDNDGRLHLTEARFLSSHVHGWNEFSLDILGNAFFRGTSSVDALFYIFYIDGDVELVQIGSGRILLRSNQLSGTAALIPLRNRRERILALNEWMSGSLGDNRIFASQREFEDYWKPRLFPELVSRKKRPQEYSGGNARWARADSVRWNLTYTEDVFPEHLWEFRNSGAMLRDWEEALPWIFMEYSWSNIVSSFNETMYMRRTFRPR